MNDTNKAFPLFLVLIIAAPTLSLILIEPSNAQTSNPPTPEFSLKTIDTGTKAIELTIKHQPFEAYTDDNDQAVSLYYNVHFKLHDAESWTAMYYCGDVFPTHSNSDTKLVYPLQLSADSSSYHLLKENAGHYYLLSEIPFNGQMDFRVQAMEGQLTSASFTGQTSDWSNIQTITIQETSASSNPTPTPSGTDLSWLVIGSLSIIAILVVLVTFRRRKRK
ncbi:MAG: hypothetical protein ACQCN6_08645 [Candidatus Bathyarchaeia archaeon]